MLVMVLFLAAFALLIYGPSDTCRVNGEPTGIQVKGEWVNSTAYISTDHGMIIIELADMDAPITVGNFIELADAMFYDNMRWHRIVDDFVIQTGDPNTRDNNPYNDGSGGSTKTIPLEIHENLTHEDGAIGMARSQELDSASSQFYICDGPQHNLDENYAVFGFVIEGMDVVRSIASEPVNGNTRPALSQQPVDEVWLYSVRIDHGFYNITEIPDGPTEPVVEGSGLTYAAGGLVVIAVALPLILVPLMFILFRRAKRSGEPL
jgi:peptidyl-prolyl cis-trans isomerase B (cyclophilin B)